ncbi:MAG: DUF4286 family protein [Chitinophagaceae bacterium]|nr:DUF4286 family protein [Chitinophagaceae bacterium]
MIIYNVTTKVNARVAEEWQKWMLELHIPHVLESGCFLQATISLLLDVDDEDGPTYAVQYFAEDRTKYEQYINEYAPLLRKEVIEKWGDACVSFRSTMQVIGQCDK